MTPHEPRYRGRPRTLIDLSLAQALLASGQSFRQVAKAVHVSPSTLQQAVRPSRRPGLLDLAEMLWPQVDKNGPIVRPELGPCWIFTGPLNNKGYGNLTRWVLAHRAAWMLTNGPIPLEWLVVMHACDNPPCCNPAHLKLDTTEANMTDMVAKGRQSRGESKSLSILAGLSRARDRGVRLGRPRAQVDLRRVLTLRAQGQSVRAIGRHLGVSGGVISRALAE